MKEEIRKQTVKVNTEYINHLDKEKELIQKMKSFFRTIINFQFEIKFTY